MKYHIKLYKETLNIHISEVDNTFYTGSYENKLWYGYICKNLEKGKTKLIKNVYKKIDLELKEKTKEFNKIKDLLEV